MCMWRAYVLIVLTKVREQHNAILIFVKIFQLERQFFSLSTSLPIYRICRNFKSGKSPNAVRICPKNLPRLLQGETGLGVASLRRIGQHNRLSFRNKGPSSALWGEIDWRQKCLPSPPNRSSALLGIRKARKICAAPIRLGSWGHRAVRCPSRSIAQKATCAIPRGKRLEAKVYVD